MSDERELPIESTARVIERLAAAHRPDGAQVFATDADGTLWDGDCAVDTFEALLDEGAVHADALAPLQALADEFRIAHAGSPTAVAQAIYAAYHELHLPDERACEMMGWAFAGMGLDELRAFATKALAARHLPARVIGEMQKLLAWARGVGLPIVVVSASPVPIVEAGLALTGIDASHVCGTTPIVEDGVVRGAVELPIPYGPGKVRALRSHVEKAEIIAAFGDSAFDLELLATATVAAAVRPKPALRARAHERPGLVLLARE